VSCFTNLHCLDYLYSDPWLLRHQTSTLKLMCSVGHKFCAARRDAFNERVAGFGCVVTKVNGGWDLELLFRKSVLRRRMCIFMYMRCPETSVRNYHYSLRYNPEGAVLICFAA